MTRDDAKKLLPIIQAYAAGETIQWFDGGAWVDFSTKKRVGAPDDMRFDNGPESYRIKPEKKVVWLLLGPQSFGKVVAGQAFFRRSDALANLFGYRRNCGEEIVRVEYVPGQFDVE